MIKINWEKSDGLIPAIIQDAQTQQILMLGYMNEESYTQTLESRKVTFFSRSRQSIWVKGATSGNTLNLIDLKIDCDGDALLIQVSPNGPTCHRETVTCFDSDLNFLNQLQGIIQGRRQKPLPNSYVSSLFEKGLDRIAQKVGEEAIETVIASKNDDLNQFESESADLLFHLMILLQVKESSLEKIVQVLKKRHH